MAVLAVVVGKTEETYTRLLTKLLSLGWSPLADLSAVFILSCLPITREETNSILIVGWLWLREVCMKEEKREGVYERKLESRGEGQLIEHQYEDHEADFHNNDERARPCLRFKKHKLSKYGTGTIFTLCSKAECCDGMGCQARCANSNPWVMCVNFGMTRWPTKRLSPQHSWHGSWCD